MSTLRFQYLFDEGAGTSVSDNSAYGNDGSLEGLAAWISAPYNSAIEIPGDSTTSMVRVPVILPWGTQTTNLPTTSYTFMFWAKLYSLENSLRSVIEKMSNEGSSPHEFTRGWYVLFRRVNATNIRLIFTDLWWGSPGSAIDNKHKYDIYNSFDPSSIFGSWHHYSFFLDISGASCKMHFDFSLLSGTTLGYTKNVSVSSANNVDMKIGNYNPSSVIAPLGGELFDVRLYEGEETPSSIYSTYPSTPKVMMIPEI